MTSVAQRVTSVALGSPLRHSESAEGEGGYCHFIDFESESSRPARGDDFSVEFGGGTPWDVVPSEGQLRAKIAETDKQLWLQVWLHGALQRDCDDYEELRRIQKRFGGELDGGSPSGEGSPKFPPFSPLSRPTLRGRDPMAAMHKASRQLEQNAKFALTLRVKQVSPLGGEVLLSTAQVCTEYLCRS